MRYTRMQNRQSSPYAYSSTPDQSETNGPRAKPILKEKTDFFCNLALHAVLYREKLLVSMLVYCRGPRKYVRTGWGGGRGGNAIWSCRFSAFRFFMITPVKKSVITSQK